MLNLQSLEQAQTYDKPFPHIVVPNFVYEQHLDDIEEDYPVISKPGSFPLETLRHGPGFARFVHEMRKPALRELVANKLGVNLERRPVTITVRGHARRTDGRIHLDRRSKLVTCLVYMNGAWEAEGGRLRLLHSPDSLEDVALEVPAARGTLLAFVNTPNAWHGHKPFEGERRVFQMSWLRSHWMLWHEKTRHHLSAIAKKVLP